MNNYYKSQEKKIDKIEDPLKVLNSINNIKKYTKDKKLDINELDINELDINELIKEEKLFKKTDNSKENNIKSLL
jgi:hypothetical protein